MGRKLVRKLRGAMEHSGMVRLKVGTSKSRLKQGLVVNQDG